MDASDIVENSFNNNHINSDVSYRNSLSLDNSFDIDHVIEESYDEEWFTPVDSIIASNWHISKNEQESGLQSSLKIRKISSDSGNDVIDINSSNTSLTNHHFAKSIESDEDDDKNSVKIIENKKNEEYTTPVDSIIASNWHISKNKQEFRLQSSLKIRKISSDSGNDVIDIISPNTSFTYHHFTKSIDSDEVDDKNSMKIIENEKDESSDLIKSVKKRVAVITSDSEDEFNNYNYRKTLSPLNLYDNIEDNSVVYSEGELSKSKNLSINENTTNNYSGLKISKDSDFEINDELYDESFNDQSEDTIEIDETDTSFVSNEDIVISSDDEVQLNPCIPRNHQTTLNYVENDIIFCSAAEYENQSKKISDLQTDVNKCKYSLRTIDLLSLSDNGISLLKKKENLEKELATEDAKLKHMVINEDSSQDIEEPLTWEQLEATSSFVMPNTLGKRALNTYATQKALTMDSLKNLHDSLATCPGENVMEDDPKGLNIELMPHQQKALVWLSWREKQKPSGGILADDMGLGKTLTMISLILKSLKSDIPTNSSDDSDKEASYWKKTKSTLLGGTLVICPASLIRQWDNEIQKRLNRNLLTVELFHGSNRETIVSRLAKYDVVITTYQIVQRESEIQGRLLGIKWRRIILDEAHIIRNHKSLTSIAVCKLNAQSRWALTGTPVHNKEMDLYALLKFLRCSPFDDLGIWKHWVANKNTGGQDRLNTVITSILLRRTKEQLQIEGNLEGLPEKKFELMEIMLDKTEQKVYQKILAFSRSMFIEFLRQRAAKNSELITIGRTSQESDEEYQQMHAKFLQIYGNSEIKSHHILVLLLRLRQICCHLSLITKMLDEELIEFEDLTDGDDIDILDKITKMDLDEYKENVKIDEARNILNLNNPVFAPDRVNKKLQLIQKVIEEKVLPNNDKVIIVSQWTKMLNIIMAHLKNIDIKCDIFCGSVPVSKRNELVSNFNDPSHKIKVLLLSLTAGGVGLNLIGANHLLLVDLHWNPQLESQAQDRIYRVGQTKPVYIYKIVTMETIEEKIKLLQEKKLGMAHDILSGVKSNAGVKLTFDDLKMLFNIGS